MGDSPCQRLCPAVVGRSEKTRRCNKSCKFQLSELMGTSRLKAEQGEAGQGCLGCFCQMLVVLTACDLAAGEMQDLAVLTAISDSSILLPPW